MSQPSWYETDLSTDPPSVEIADGDTRTITVSAGEAVTGASAELVLLGPMTVVGSGVAGGAVSGKIEAISLGANIASVRITGLTRGNVYELSVTFVAGVDDFTNTTIVECVA